MKFWVNIWRASRLSTEAFEATVHMSERDAIDLIADEMAEESCAYIGTIRVDGSTRDCASWVDLSEDAEEALRERKEEEESLDIEGRLLRWRQAGL